MKKVKNDSKNLKTEKSKTKESKTPDENISKIEKLENEIKIYNYRFFNFLADEKIFENISHGKNINDYLSDEEKIEIDNFDELFETLLDKDFFTIEIIYYFKAMNYLSEFDNSLSESLEIADEFGYEPRELNSELLASLLASQNFREKFVAELKGMIDTHFEFYKEKVDELLDIEEKQINLN